MNHDEKCDCPGCFTVGMVTEIQNCLIALSGVEAIYKPNGEPDPRIKSIINQVETLGQDIMAKLDEFYVKNEIGVPFAEWFEEPEPEFFKILRGQKRSN